MKGKALSLGAKLFAIAFAVVVFVLNGVFRWGFSAGEIIAVAGFIAAAFLPVDISKIRQAREGQ